MPPKPPYAGGQLFHCVEGRVQMSPPLGGQSVLLTGGNLSESPPVRGRSPELLLAGGHLILPVGGPYTVLLASEDPSITSAITEADPEDTCMDEDYTYGDTIRVLATAHEDMAYKDNEINGLACITFSDDKKEIRGTASMAPIFMSFIQLDHYPDLLILLISFYFHVKDDPKASASLEASSDDPAVVKLDPGAPASVKAGSDVPVIVTRTSLVQELPPLLRPATMILLWSSLVLELRPLPMAAHTLPPWQFTKPPHTRMILEQSPTPPPDPRSFPGASPPPR